MNRLFFIFLFPFLLSAQDSTMDSLKLALKNAKHDTTRCNVLNAMIEAEGDDAIWPIYNEQLLKLTEKNSKIASSLKNFYLRYLAAAYNNAGFFENIKGENSKALELWEKSFKIQKEIKDKSGIAISLNNMGSIYEKQGDITKALDYYHQSLKIREEINDKGGIANALTNIGLIYNNQGDITKALDYYQRSLKIQEEIKDTHGIAISLNNIASIYELKKDIPKALEYFNKCLKVMQEIQEKNGIAFSLSNIGGIYRRKGDISKALEYYQQSLKIQEEINDKFGITNSSNNIAIVMLEKGVLSVALNFGKRSLQTANELGYPENIRRAAITLKKIYKKQNKFNEALAMYELEIQMRDSINNTETKKASIKKQFQYEYEKKAAADSVKNAEEQKVKNAILTAQTAQLKQEKTQRIALYGGLVLVIAFSGFVFNRFRVTQKQKIIIEQQKVLVDSAFAHLEEKNKEVMDSIRYAKRIQTALLTSEKYIERKLNELNS